MTPKLTATGGTLSADLVVSATGGGAVTAFAAVSPGGTWAAVGSRVGDGPLTVALAAGFWVLYASLDDDGLPSDPAWAAVASADEAVYTSVRAAVKNRLLSLGLPLNPDGEMVYDRWATTPVNLMFPCVEMVKTNASERDESRLNATNDIGYPVPLAICDRRDEVDQSRNAEYDLWRQRVVRAFHGVPLETPRENWICRVEFGPIADQGGESFEFYVSTLTVWATCREPRGVMA